jgi:hypothetical protein
MERPYMNMMRPWESDYKERKKDIIIYSYYQNHRYDEDDEDDEDDGGYHHHMVDMNGKKDGIDHWWSGAKDQPQIPNIKLDKMDLQQLLDMIPEGIKPSEIKIGFNLDAGDMGPYGYEVYFYYTKTFPAEPEQYKKDMATWQKHFDEYQVKENAYQEWLKNEEVRKLEEQLSRLKK